MISTMEKFNAPAETVNATIKIYKKTISSLLGLLKGLLTNIILLVSLAS
jgi:ribosomal protein L10